MFRNQTGPIAGFGQIALRAGTAFSKHAEPALYIRKAMEWDLELIGIDFSGIVRQPFFHLCEIGIRGFALQIESMAGALEGRLQTGRQFIA